jgi:hypothetical protein
MYYVSIVIHGHLGLIRPQVVRGTDGKLCFNWPWGSGLGRPLHVAEFDGNNWGLDQRLAVLEAGVQLRLLLISLRLDHHLLFRLVVVSVTQLRCLFRQLHQQ